MKLVREITASILLIVLSIVSFILSIFQVDIPIYIISTITLLLIIFLIIRLLVNYEIDSKGILLICFAVYILITQILFLFAYNEFLWAIKTLKVMVYILDEIFRWTIAPGVGMGKIQDILTLSICTSCFLILFVILYIIHLKKRNSD